ncbi:MULTISPECIES: glycosyltransferase [Pseudomonas]|uniref:Glycosyltransferase family 4 protein n=1 Tax=Pseudomonas izuensis TaxID=2684212 RepID=A0ABM7RL38_9PSED|nr:MULTISPECIES: glycosyltransferase [Pseudomonas]RKS21370.1 glycosyltransferase involved in cell wall biosynthesis [Pseudomonas sp. WPR_5_2]BCX65832.1 glycosyltransferase family 4 protein [Pseudomonas izuensis]
MSIINVMWASGGPFASTHKVHQQILSQASPSVPVETWLLQGHASECGVSVGGVREWGLSSSRLKGRHFWRLTKPWMQARFRSALKYSDAHLLLLDGLGVARAFLPILETLPHIRAVVIFHGSTRLHPVDRVVFGRFPASRLTLVAVSKTLAASLSEDLQVPVMTLRSAFDPAAFRSALLPREQARTRLGLPLDKTPVLGAVGRLVAGKGFACLLDAFAGALPEKPDLKLVIVGEGTARAALEARIDELQLRGKVLLPGHMDDVAQLYRAFDWVAMPSLNEGLGLILQEAVMAGVPVLSSELDVFREQLADAGWYAPIENVDVWRDIIARAFSVSPETIAAEQYQALAPDQSWLSFSQTARALLS